MRHRVASELVLGVVETFEPPAADETPLVDTADDESRDWVRFLWLS